MSEEVNYPPHFFKRPDYLEDPLYVVTVVFNSPRWRSRLKLYSDFVRHVEQSGAILYTVEAAFGDRAFAVTQPDNPRHIQVRMKDEYFAKETLINRGVQGLPLDWKKVAIIDADIMFARADWMDEARHCLEHHPVIQMWSEAHDLGPNHETIAIHRSFAYCYVHNVPRPKKGNYYYGSGKKGFFFHPGYAWAYRREAWNALGGMIDHAILGSADNHQAYCLTGDGEETLKHDLSERYKFLVMLWQERAEKYIQRRIGYMPGTILHYFHGNKSSRRYQDRWQILSSTGYDPDLDLKRDWQGIYQLTDRNPELRAKLHAYAKQRNEDLNEIDSAWADTMLLNR